MLSAGTTHAAIAGLAAEHKLNVWVTHHNAPGQTVVGGQSDAIEELGKLLLATGIEAQILSVPGAFHTPLMQEAQPILRDQLATVNWQMPRITFVSGVTNRTVTSTADIPENLVAQMVEPVRYAELIEGLAAVDSPLFVEIGPQQVLTRLNRRILANRQALAIGSDHPSRPAKELLVRVQAFLECHGVELSPAAVATRLSSDRLIAPKSSVHTRIGYFDATAARRHRLRSQALSPNGAEVSSHHYAPVNGNGNGKHAADLVRAKISDHASDRSLLHATAPASGSPLAVAPVNHSAATLKTFLIDFVIEQTGYPCDVVQLDADLEADLGIDSIKRAQLFGELREYFDFATADRAGLMSCRTLGQIVQLLGTYRGIDKPTHDAQVGKAADQPSGKASQLRGHSPGLRDTAAAARRNHDGKPESPSSNGSTRSAEIPTLAEHLVRFVMEQTGYPQDVITLDADLEADLGIDSIKKAQLFGELREHLGGADAVLRQTSLNEFRTLRHVLSALGEAHPAFETTPGVPAVAGPTASSGVRELDLPPVRQSSAAFTQLQTVRFQGTHDEIGFQCGRELRTQIQAGLRMMAIEGCDRDIEKRRSKLSGDGLLEALHPAVRAEITGLARSSGVHPLSVLAWNERLASSESKVRFFVERVRGADFRREADGLWQISFCWRDNSPVCDAIVPVIQTRQPIAGHPHVLFGLPGQIGAFAGINSIGLAIFSGPIATSPNASSNRFSLKPASACTMLLGVLLETAEDVESALANLRRMKCAPGSILYLEDRQADCFVRVEVGVRSLHIDRELRNSRVEGHSLFTGQSHQHFATAKNGNGHRSNGHRTSVASPEVPAPKVFACVALNVKENCAWVGSPMRHGDPSSEVMRIHFGQMFGQAADLVPVSDVASEPFIPSVSSEQPASLAGASVTSRFVLRTELSARRGRVRKRPAWSGSALILGSNRISKELRRRLAEQGVRTTIVPTSDPATALSAVERAWKRGPAMHMFVLTPHDVAATTAGPLSKALWHDRRHAGFLIPFIALQRWISLVAEAGRLDDASLIAATSLGGDFGFSGKIAACEGGGIGGLLKAIAIELWVQGHRRTPIKVIDTSADEPAKSIVSSIFRELATPSFDVEVGYRRGRRFVVRAVREPQTQQPQSTIATGGVWVCTGGARGITAYVARELGRRYGLRLHLLGTSALPQIADRWRNLQPADQKARQAEVMDFARAVGRHPLKEWQRLEQAIEIDQTLRDMKAEGIAVTYHACDVADPVALARVLDEIRNHDGPIEGIIHGAGFGKDARFDRKELENVDRCLRAKVDGAAALMELTRNDPLKYFIAFGSISGRFGANGHSDYSAANDMLAKQVNAFRHQRPDCAAATFHWHAWGDVGMATKPETQLALEMIGMQFMPAAEGLQHLISELEAGLPTNEVLITDDQYYRKFYPADPTITPTPNGEKALGLPLVERFSGNPGGQIGHAVLDPVADPFLAEHRFDNEPLLPVVVGLELLCEGVVGLADKSVVGALKDVHVVSGLRFHGDRLHDLRTVAHSTASRKLQCEVQSDFLTRDGRLVEAGRVHIRGHVELAERRRDLRTKKLVVGRGGWTKVEYPSADSKFYLGPPLRNLRSFCSGKGRAWGRIIAPLPVELAGAHRLSMAWVLPIAVLDACLYTTGLLAWSQVAPGIALPMGFGEIRLGRHPAPGEDCLVETCLLRTEPGRAYFDFTLCGENREVLIDVNEYRIDWLPT